MVNKLAVKISHLHIDKYLIKCVLRDILTKHLRFAQTKNKKSRKDFHFNALQMMIV